MNGRVARRAVLAAAAAVAAALAAWPAAAPAFYGNGASIVSASFERLEQGDDGSSSAAISRSGRYVAFQTQATNFFPDDDPDPPGRLRAGGIFRRDLATGTLAPVADGDQLDENTGTQLIRGARSPSISADGRYVAFSTAQPLVAADINDNVDVYVRDMTVPKRSPGAFTLVSAKSGGDVPATYAPRPVPLPGRNPGADVWPGVALSADGRSVVFRTVEVSSDLPDRGAADTPGYNVFVRNLDTKATRLVSTVTAGGGPAGGAFGPAVISGDGTTVAWVGQNAPAQTPFLSGEFQDGLTSYFLWKRIANGPAAPTRRITGAVDLDDPGCPPNGSITTDPTATGPCYGPLTDAERGFGDIATRPPVLSDDGYTVAFLASANLRPNLTGLPGRDVFVTSMNPGVSRKDATQELTREGAPSDEGAIGQVEDLAISGDGRRIAFTAARSRFVLPSPQPIGTFRSFPDFRDVFVIDRAAGTLERVTRAADGGDSNGDASRPTLSRDGGTVAFASAASNLLFGDANERDDVFVATRQPEPADEPPPPPPADTPPVQEDPPVAPSLRVTHTTLKDGRVRLTVAAPSKGQVDVLARAQVKVRSKRSLQVVASGGRGAPRRSQVTVTLALLARFRTQVRPGGSLRASARVRFTPRPAGQARTRTVTVVFRRPKHPATS